MSPPYPPDLVVLTAAVLTVGAIAVLIIVAIRSVRSRIAAGTWPFWMWSGDAGCRHCRYCHFGRACLQEETARLEGDDLVEVRCFVCRSCGLPLWTVARSAVLKRAA